MKARACTRRLVILALATGCVCTAALADGGPTVLEIWAAGRVDDTADPTPSNAVYHASNECGVARFDGETGEFLSWWMHPEPGVGLVETPDTRSDNYLSLFISLGPDNRVYVVAGSPEHIHERIVYRYELDGTPAPADGQSGARFVKDTGYHGDLRYANCPVVFTDEHVYIVGQNYWWSGVGNTYNGVFRFNYDGSPAGTQGGGDSRFTSNLTYAASAIAIDAAGNVYLSNDATDSVDRYDTSGNPDPDNPWVTTIDNARYIAFDGDGRLYVAVKAAIHRWDANGDPAGNPDELPGSKFAKDGISYTYDGDPYYALVSWRAQDVPVVHVGADGKVYGGTTYVHQYNPPYSDWWQNGIMRWDPATGDMLDGGKFFANIGADAAPLEKPTGGMLFIVEQEVGGTVLLLK